MRQQYEKIPHLLKYIKCIVYLPENAVPITIIFGIPSVMPIFTIIGIKINDATVCEINVATDPENSRMKTKANQGLDSGSADKVIKPKIRNLHRKSGRELTEGNSI
jgi:hypothetical protein